MIVHFDDLEFLCSLVSEEIVSPEKGPRTFGTETGTGARFSKVPKLSVRFLGVEIPSVSQERRGFKSSNFTVILLFVTLKTCQKIGFPKQAVGSFTNGFSGLSRNGPLIRQIKMKNFRKCLETNYHGPLLDSFRFTVRTPPLLTSGNCYKYDSIT